MSETATTATPRAGWLRPLLIGFGIPMAYQIPFVIVAFSVSETILPPIAWDGLHLLTMVFFLVCPILALWDSSLKSTWHRLGGNPVAPMDAALIVLLGGLIVFVGQMLYRVVAVFIFGATFSFGFSQSAQALLPFLILTLVAGPLAEEVLFRGLFGAIFPNLWVFLLVSSVLDAALHIDPLNFVPLLWMWLILGYIRRRWNSIYLTIAIHVLLNGVALLWHFIT
jgi:membrane protease YdiL (CAAX protease family)